MRHSRRLLTGAAALLFLDGDRHALAVDGEPTQASALDSLLAHASSTGAPHVEERDSVSVLAAPLRGKDRVIGALVVERESSRPFRSRERAVAALIAQQAAIAIENAALYAEARSAGEHIRESEKAVALGHLSAGLAHELRNPLNTLSILTFAMIEREPETSPARADLEIVRAELSRMSQLLDQFLDFARPRDPSFARLRVTEVLDETLALVTPEAAKRGIRITRSDDPISSPVWGDGDQLKQVFLNLSLNALQAMSPGGRLEAGTLSARGGVAVRFADDGPGIPEVIREHLFEPFVTARAGGTGLGLAVARRIVEAHSGRLSIDGGERGGTVATVWLPS